MVNSVEKRASEDPHSTRAEATQCPLVNALSTCAPSVCSCAVPLPSSGMIISAMDNSLSPIKPCILKPEEHRKGLQAAQKWRETSTPWESTWQRRRRGRFCLREASTPRPLRSLTVFSLAASPTHPQAGPIWKNFDLYSLLSWMHVLLMVPSTPSFTKPSSVLREVKHTVPHL